MINDVATFNSEIAGTSPITRSITIGGDILDGTTFDLDGKTLTDLTIDMRGLSAGEKITLTNGTVTNLTIYNNTDASLDINSVTLPNGATVK